jgi:two-component system, cell cycle sensor histidine kinase and response regulator CckA
MPEGRLLLIDDEPSLIKLMSEYLTRLGYTVEARRSAEEALELLNRGERFDLLIVDLTLPDMNGEEFMLRATEIDSQARVLLSSGYIWVPEKLQPDLRKRVAFLQKPYVPKMLAREVERLVGS